ncbi:MAG TPA: flagellar biosynthesis anti-sigma factor FlgM [Bryobacteraceae bacterium]|nr:flagellar biosynthesis anti-sigma factor FlgM [Bryobacteraceae bacterium]
MMIKSGDSLDASRLGLDQTRGSQGAGSAGAPTSGSAQQNHGNDSISLSTPGDIVQQALTAGASSRAARIQELKNQIDGNQYQVDPQATSRAIINAHLAGE